MFESLSTSTFSASTESIATSLQPSLQPSLPPLSEVAPTSYEGSANSHPPLWEPTEPQYCKAIADHYDVSRKSVQEWFQKVKEACPWFDLSDLKLEDDRYTPLCIGLMGRYRTSGLPFKVWKTQIWEENTELVAAFQNSYQPTDPVSDRSYLPPIDRTAAGSLVPTGSSYLNALAAEEKELQALEAQELALLGRMSNSLERLTQNQSQWNRTNDLRRQRLLRQTRLEAATLATELEAEFDETLRESQYNIRSGNIAAPGKPQAPLQSQPA